MNSFWFHWNLHLKIDWNFIIRNKFHSPVPSTTYCSVELFVITSSIHGSPFIFRVHLILFIIVTDLPQTMKTTRFFFLFPSSNSSQHYLLLSASRLERIWVNTSFAATANIKANNGGRIVRRTLLEKFVEIKPISFRAFGDYNCVCNILRPSWQFRKTVFGVLCVKLAIIRRDALPCYQNIYTLSIPVGNLDFHNNITRNARKPREVME